MLETREHEFIDELVKRVNDLVPSKPELKNLRKFTTKLSVPNPAANFTVDSPADFGPESYYFWDVRRVTVNSFTAGTVSMYTDPGAAANSLEFVFQQAGSFWVPAKSLPLEEGERLVFVTGSAFAGGLDISLRGYMVPRPLWAEYLS